MLANCFGIRKVAFIAFESAIPVEFLVKNYREQLLELLQCHMRLLGEAVSLGIIGIGFSVFEPNDHLIDGGFDSDMDMSDEDSDDSMDDSDSNMSGPSYRLRSSSSSIDSGYST